MKSTILAVTLAAALPLAAQAADPTATGLPTGFSFQEYLGSGPVGIGAVDVDSTLFFIDEQTVADRKSWMIFFDSAAPQMVTATITFDEPVMAVFTRRLGIDLTTPIFGKPGVTYGSARLTGLEVGDSLSWTPGSNTITLVWNVSDPGDHIRVLTAVPAVPEPANWALFAGGLTVLGWLVRRRRIG